MNSTTVADGGKIYAKCMKGQIEGQRGEGAETLLHQPDQSRIPRRDQARRRGKSFVSTEIQGEGCIVDQPAACHCSHLLSVRWSRTGVFQVRLSETYLRAFKWTPGCNPASGPARSFFFFFVLGM